MALRYQLATHLVTHMGLVRTNNEDSVEQDIDHGLVVLADGMGGYAAGEVASSIATSTILQIVRAELPALNGSNETVNALTAEASTLKSAVERAHTAVFTRASEDPHCAGMGTTVDACLVRDGRLTIAHIGDSRVYRFRRGRLTQLTHDHSLLEELIARGHYSREEAERFVRRNIVTRALGVDATVDVDVLSDVAEVGDLYLLCSDGLTDMVDDAAIERMLAGDSGGRLEALADRLVDAALQAGGRDNVSVALLRLNPPQGESNKPWLRKLQQKMRPASSPRV